MEKKKVDQKELPTICLCAPTIPLNPSKTFVVHHTSSYNTLDRNRGDI